MAKVVSRRNFTRFRSQYMTLLLLYPTRREVSSCRSWGTQPQSELSLCYAVRRGKCNAEMFRAALGRATWKLL